MHHSDWSYWFWIKRTQKGRSFQRWLCDIYGLHQRNYLDSLTERIINYSKYENLPCKVQVSSIWIDGTPQALAIARTKQVKCELADLLFLVEELDNKMNLISKKSILIQGKNTVHPKN